MKNFTLQLLILLLLSFSIYSQESWKLYDDSQVATVEITVAPEDLEWMYEEENLESDSLHLAAVHFSNAYIDETIDLVGFSLRGNTSRHSQKKSFKLSFNEFVPGREFYGVDKMNLNGEHNDPSIIRSKLCWDIFQKIGMTASRAAHAAVYVNGTYYGLYISVEHIDDEFLQKNFTDDSGNLWKCLWPADLAIIGSGNPEDYHPDAEGRPYELRTNEEEYDYSQLARLISIINNTPDELLADSLEKILNIPDVIKYFVIDVLTGSWDDYWFLKNNYYLYHMPSEDKFHLIPYDYDNTFSIDWFEKDWAIINPYQFGSDESRPLADRILANAQYRDLFTHFLQFYSENVLELSLWETRIDSLKDMITTFAENDTYRTLDYGFTMDDFHNSYSSSSYYNQHVKRGLKEFINERNISIEGQLTWEYGKPIAYEINWLPELPGADDSIHVTASAFSHAGLQRVEIHFQHADSLDVDVIPMTFLPVNQTLKVEEADRWIGTIPPLGANGTGQFQIVVEDVFGLTQNYPRTSYIQVQASGESDVPIVINEFLAINETINSDEAGEFDDWLELYNLSDEDMALSGMYLTDDPSELTKWQFPFGGVMIPAHGFLLVWCDNDEEQGSLHTNFKLSGNGEFLALIDTNGVSIIDSLTFGDQTDDISYGRYPDGAEEWQFFTTPSPGEANTLTGIKNEDFLPEIFQLKQNYPNPFNPTTVISYSLPKAGKAEVTIYNSMGQKIKTLIQKNHPAGNYNITFNAENHSSGVYFYQLKTDYFTAAKKMILIK